MPVKRYDTDEVLRGFGDVVRQDDGQPAGLARYYVVVQHSVLNAGSMGNPDAELRGMGRIHGSLMFENTGPLGWMDLVGVTVVVTLEDGRRLSCLIRDNDGNFVGGRFEK